MTPFIPAAHHELWTIISQSDLPSSVAIEHYVLPCKRTIFADKKSGFTKSEKYFKNARSNNRGYTVPTIEEECIFSSMGLALGITCWDLNDSSTLWRSAELRINCR